MTTPERDARAVLRQEHKSLENLVVLYITQAMLGLLSPRVRAVSIELADRLLVHFALANADDDIDDDIEAILVDLDALLDAEDIPESWKIEPRVYVGPVDEGWPGLAFRRVYEAKP